LLYLSGRYDGASISDRLGQGNRRGKWRGEHSPYVGFREMIPRRSNDW
jgi:hypothetical protein